jgi:hypothetical protein
VGATLERLRHFLAGFRRMAAPPGCRKSEADPLSADVPAQGVMGELAAFATEPVTPLSRLPLSGTMHISDTKEPRHALCPGSVAYPPAGRAI